MTQKPSSNGSSLPKAHSKEELIRVIKRIASLQPDCSAIDLDDPSNQRVYPPASPLGVWVDTWHMFVGGLASREDAESGIRAARSFLFELSRRFDNMVFSADASRPPLDQFGPPDKTLEMMFRESTCYTSIRPIATYRGRKVYLGESPDTSNESLKQFALSLK